MDSQVVSLFILALNIAAVSAILNFELIVFDKIDALLALYFKSKAACVAVLIGLSASLVLSTLPNPTLLALMPDEILASVMAPLAIFVLVMALFAIIGADAIPDKSPAN